MHAVTVTAKNGIKNLQKSFVVSLSALFLFSVVDAKVSSHTIQTSLVLTTSSCCQLLEKVKYLTQSFNEKIVIKRYFESLEQSLSDCMDGKDAGMFTSERYVNYLAPQDEAADSKTESGKPASTFSEDDSFPEFQGYSDDSDDEEDLQRKLRQLMRHRFFRANTDGHKRRYGMCEVSPCERRVIADVLTLLLDIRLQGIGLV